MELREKLLETERLKRRREQEEQMQLLRLKFSSSTTLTGATVLGHDNEVIYDKDVISCARHGKSALEFCIEEYSGRIAATCTACGTNGFLCYAIGVPVGVIKEFDLEAITLAYEHSAEINHTLICDDDIVSNNQPTSKRRRNEDSVPLLAPVPLSPSSTSDNLEFECSETL